jgi:DNA-binding CsgD family transcriptional regulator
MFRFRIVFIFFVFLINQDLKAQSGIEGQLIIDTVIWRPIAYLSIIPDLEKLFSMSNEMIIDAVDIDASGKFSFNNRYFPKEDNLFRIHVAKKSDPPASLNIGGREENYFFIVANNQTYITVKDNNNREFIKDVSIKGYYPNDVIKLVNDVTGYLDSTAIDASSIKNDLIKSAVFEKLRFIADTCSNPIVSLYAIYKCDFEKNYSINQQFYKDFQKKWRQNKSSYFEAFRKKISVTNSISLVFAVIIAFISFLVGFFICWIIVVLLKKKNNIVQELSIQERKIYSLVLEGKSNKEIADTLMIELSTVKSHLSSIYSKLKISSRKDILNLNLNR